MSVTDDCVGGGERRAAARVSPERLGRSHKPGRGRGLLIILPPAGRSAHGCGAPGLEEAAGPHLGALTGSGDLNSTLASQGVRAKCPASPAIPRGAGRRVNCSEPQFPHLWNRGSNGACPPDRVCWIESDLWGWGVAQWQDSGLACTRPWVQAPAPQNRERERSGQPAGSQRCRSTWSGMSLLTL